MKSEFGELMPPKLVTSTFFAPAEPPGVTTVIVVELTTLILWYAQVPPNLTTVAPVKPVPVIVTLVPPSVLPVAGVTEVTVGRAAVRAALWVLISAADSSVP